ncbi:hypothetical protein QQS21_001674 [Conoideocrella luteorostrata]|uniref:Uncharacterized protein n=1 Tax=Conoideocrella luteorostrata TaxID=1105319 RepID=A0AAJ0CZK6_9HYPO|nr:hypothetical protein QQS21_001674 [Conoideocrella luteorostrata]
MRSFHLVGLLPAVLAGPIAQRSEPAPLLVPEDVNHVIPDRYIVTLRDEVGVQAVEDLATSMSADADHVYDEVFKGFAGTFNETTLSALRNHNQVDFIEKDTVVTMSCAQQRNSDWGLARMSSKRKGEKNYRYNEIAGSGACAYVIDTGIDDKHPDFERRAKQIKTFVKGQKTDGQGHGTHCAGTIGSKTYGVAKKIKLFGVKVLDNQGSGSASSVIAGMNFVARDHKKRGCKKGVVVNMSLGGPYSKAQNQAAAALVRSGAFVAVAAGNSKADAAKTSPASEKTVCTVGASDINDNFASFSNYGKSVAIIAPGVDILSTLPGKKTGKLSGTSMASPHIAGLAGYIASRDGVKAGNLCRRLQQLSTKKALKKVPRSTVNNLAYNGVQEKC